MLDIEAYGTKDFRIDWTEPQDVMPGTVWDDYDVEITDYDGI